ncbi:hypothetical protein F4780DRAFT_777480 [Xylariomycetidae sp. FL0641]|nr:hypothetical protein F4780DRAFT_777480 [Xylariomycetidae sp. FL0641]
MSDHEYTAAAIGGSNEEIQTGMRRYAEIRAIPNPENLGCMCRRFLFYTDGCDHAWVYDHACGYNGGVSEGYGLLQCTGVSRQLVTHVDDVPISRCCPQCQATLDKEADIAFEELDKEATTNSRSTLEPPRPTSVNIEPSIEMAHMTNPLATVDQLYRRSSFGALPPDLQDLIFFATQCLTQAAGVLLRIPQSVTAQANVLLARYWLVESPLADEFADVSAAALFLVAKLSAHPCQPRDVCNVYAYLQSSHSPLRRPPSSSSSSDPPPPPPPDNDDADADADYLLSEAEYAGRAARTTALERRILCALSFDAHVALPHALAVTYLQALDFLGRDRKAIAGRALEYLNTGLLSPQLVYATHQPCALATAAVYSAARDLGAKLPGCEWWEVFDVDREELGFLVVALRSVEGWVRKQQEDYPDLLSGGIGVVTRAWVEEQMRKKGLRFGNEPEVMDEEAAMMRSLDEKAGQMEE